MPRAGWVKPVSDRRLSDLVSVGVLTRVFPPELVDEVIAASGRTEQRSRSLPARVMAYFSIGMALYSEGSYEDVLGQLTDGLAWASGWSDPGCDSYRLPSKSAIFQAGAGWGAEPVAGLFATVARPIATAQTPGAWLAGRRLVAVDGTCLDVADTAENAAYFGRPGVNKGEKAAFPQARVLALAECGTHAIFAARVGTYRESEAKLCEGLLEAFAPGMLVLADRGFFSYVLWRNAIATGADLLWRIRTDQSGPKPTHVRDLDDGSWLAHLRGPPRAPPPAPPPAARSRCSCASSTTASTMDGTTRRSTDCSPRSPTPTRPPRPIWPPPISSVGRSRTPSTSSRPTSADPGSCCARSPPTWSCRRFGAACAATTRSAA